ncbi:protein associated with UVRAG as autophagy enhancer isoform X2 [Anabas testudineus]|uniref:Rubicon Homology domain-containing protein n=2 Tax=Anabas testudineus TaxID=64144 RepID=A0A3Q1IVC7_ANATE|nr:protein associated with UVRAG as autophagy enhancer isoform X2 [Anabas testudineus]
MEGFRNVHSSLYRSRCVSWCVESAELQTRVNKTQTATGAAPHGFHPQQEHQLVGSGPIPLLFLSPPETGEEHTKSSHQQPQTTFPKRTHDEVHSNPSRLIPHSSHTGIDTTGHSDGDRNDASGSKGNVRPPQIDNRTKENPSPENEAFLLPRSSPVISRRHRPVSWHGGGTDASDPKSADSLSPACASLSQDQHGRLAVSSLEDLASKPSSRHRSSPVQEDKKQRCISVSSNLNNFLISLFHLPFIGQQGLTEEHRGRGLTSCDGRRSPDPSTHNSKERRSSGVSEFSADIFKTSCELDKENAHFIVVDMVLEVLEGVKWNLSSDQWTSSSDTHQHTDRRTCTHRHTSSAEDSLLHEHKQRCKVCRHTQSHGTCNDRHENNKRRHSDEDMKILHNNTHSAEDAHTQQHTQNAEEEDSENHEVPHQPKTFSVLSTDSGFEDCGDTTLTQKACLRNAESLAQQLVMEFRRSWLPSREPRRGRLSLRSSLQELPGTGSVAASSSSLTEEIRLRTRMRGSLSWAPPRFQIIFTVQPTRRRSEVVSLQNFLCAGCGTKVEPRYIKKLRYCEYLGRYFCDCCHSGSDALIPGRVLSSWDFGRFPVSDFSKQLLDSVWHQPLFDLTCVGKTLYSRVKELDKLKELQEQLMGIKKLLKACRLSESVMTEFEQLPAHLLEQPHLFSMDDLLRVKKGQLVVRARAVLHAAIYHIENCKLCLARGFICEFCRDRDIIFPFQTDVCKRCPVCKTCFHKQCFVGKKCPKCARIQSRKKHAEESKEFGN